MIHLGQVNTLEILRETDHGVYLIDNEDNEVLLPNRYVPEQFKIWDKIDVFVTFLPLNLSLLLTG